MILVERNRRKNIKYQAEEIHYQARIDPDRLPMNVRGVPMTAVVDSVRELFTQLIRRAAEGLVPSDLIRFCIQAEGLDKPISTKLMPVSTLTVEKLMSAVMKVLQSKDHIELDEGFSVDVITIARPWVLVDARLLTLLSIGYRKVVFFPFRRMTKDCAVPRRSCLPRHIWKTIGQQSMLCEMKGVRHSSTAVGSCMRLLESP